MIELFVAIAIVSGQPVPGVFPSLADCQAAVAEVRVLADVQAVSECVSITPKEVRPGDKA